MFLAFGLIEWAALVLFVILAPLSIWADRDGKDSPKWILLAAVLVGWGLYRNDTLTTMWHNLFSLDTLAFIGKYALIGVVYAVFEFLYASITVRAKLKKSWPAFKTQYLMGDKAEESKVAAEFCRCYSPLRQSLFNATCVDQQVQIVVNSYVFRDTAGAWVILWPIYLVDLVLGRVLADFWSFMAKFALFLAQAYSKIFFTGIFK